MTSAEPIIKEIFIDDSPERVFEFIVDPSKMVRWLGSHVEFEPVRGGHMRIDPNGRDIIRGRVLEVVRPSRFVFTWGFENSDQLPAGSTVVEITLHAEGKGTRLRLVHRDLPPESRPQHEYGWTHYLGRLNKVAEGIDVGADPLADQRHG